MNEPSTGQQRSGTRSLMLWGAVAAAVLLAAVLLWPLLPGPETGTPGNEPRQNAATGMRSNQGAGESTVGKADPNRPEDATGGKARDIQETARGVSLTAEQREQIRAYFARQPGHKTERVDFTLSIGAAVPNQVALREIPPEIADIVNGYRGDEYVLVGDQLVIVDRQSRRVVAIIPGMA